MLNSEWLLGSATQVCLENLFMLDDNINKCLCRPHEYPFEKLEFGRWQIKINSESGACKVKHLSRLKLVIKGPDDNIIYRYERKKTLNSHSLNFRISKYKCKKMTMLLKCKWPQFRLDPWAKYVLPTPRNIYDHHFWNPPSTEVYEFKSPKPKRPASLKVNLL